MPIYVDARRDDHFTTYGSTIVGDVEVYVNVNPFTHRKDVWIADYQRGEKFYVPAKNNDDAIEIFRAISSALQA